MPRRRAETDPGTDVVPQRRNRLVAELEFSAKAEDLLGSAGIEPAPEPDDAVFPPDYRRMLAVLRRFPRPSFAASCVGRLWIDPTGKGQGVFDELKLPQMWPLWCAWNRAMQDGQSWIDSKFHHRALVGEKEPIASAGKLVGYRTVFSDSLAAKIGTNLTSLMRDNRVAVQVNIGPDEEYTFRADREGLPQIEHHKVIDGEAEKISETGPLPEATGGNLP